MRFPPYCNQTELHSCYKLSWIRGRKRRMKPSHDSSSVLRQIWENKNLQPNQAWTVTEHTNLLLSVVIFLFVYCLIQTLNPFLQTPSLKGSLWLSSHQETTPLVPPASQQVWFGTWVSCPPSTYPPPKQHPLPPQAPWTSAPHPAWAAAPAAAERKTKDARQTPQAQNPYTHMPLASVWNAPASWLTSVPQRRRRGRLPSQQPGQPSSANTAPKSTPAWGLWRCTFAHTLCPACAPPVERLSPGRGFCVATSAHTQVRPMFRDTPQHHTFGTFALDSGASVCFSTTVGLHWNCHCESPGHSLIVWFVMWASSISITIS